MPLASSREASLSRAERVKAGKKVVRKQQRLSLPSTIESVTKATEDKARRRQSIRRESLASFKEQAEKLKSAADVFVSKENAPPKRFSPPITRSASKKERFDAPSQSGGGRVLSFSPPNQAENARREREELLVRESER
jgi:hypothetical protein